MCYRTCCLLLLSLWPLLGLAADPAAGRNALYDHPSPYLAMHGADPVDWQVWDPALLKRAEREGKLLFISSGYFACHWCHVMHRESFRSPAIAERLNRLAIPVKLDRELWPDLDAGLIEFVSLTRGHAGWPLNVVLTPQGFPLLGFVYLPPEQFGEVLTNLQERWREAPLALQTLARSAAAQWPRMDALPEGEPPSTAALSAAFEEAIESLADELSGGFGDQSKFPTTPQLQVLLRLQAARPDPGRAQFLRLTLDQMADRGLRDHLGGGFFRYTVDPGWNTPHFEKMLTDNAQLAALYLEAADVLQVPRYRAIGLETLDFLLRELRHPSGGYISSLSALDDAEVEGGYYLWSLDELRVALGPEGLRQARERWDLSGAPAFEAGYLLIPRPANGAGKANDGVERLLEVRARRGLPRDDKRIAGWNGLVLYALAAATARSSDRIYREAGNELARLIQHHFLADGKLVRAREEAIEFAARLEDYALLGLGLLEWGELTGEAQWLDRARALAEAAWREHYSGRGWDVSVAGLKLPGGQDRPALPDSALPSPSAWLLALTRRLDQADRPVVGKKRWAQAERSARFALAGDPFDFASHLSLLLEKEVAVVSQ